LQPGAVMRSRHFHLLAVVAAGLALAQPTAAADRSKAPKGAAATVYRDAASPDGVKGIGIESQDIISMTDAMLRDLLSVPQLMSAATPPRIVVDAQYFKNESSEILDKAMITDRLRVGLNRAAAGRVRFIGRQYFDMVQLERDAKDQGIVDVGTTGSTRAQAGIDYRLVGRIGTRDAVDTRTGTTSRYSMYTFELIDMEYGELIWSNIYEFKKENRDDVVYR
jgi:hypothetical protein